MYPDIAFEVLLPVDVDLSIFRFQIPEFEWQGKGYPQGEPQGYFGPNFKIKKTPVPYAIKERLPLVYQSNDWQCLSISGPGLFIFKESLSGTMAEDKDYSLKKLMEFLILNQPKWAIIFEPDFDQIDEVVEGNFTTVIEKITFSLTVEKRGYIFYNRGI